MIKWHFDFILKVFVSFCFLTKGEVNTHGQNVTSIRENRGKIYGKMNVTEQVFLLLVQINHTFSHLKERRLKSDTSKIKVIC